MTSGRMLTIFFQSGSRIDSPEPADPTMPARGIAKNGALALARRMRRRTLKGFRNEMFEACCSVANRVCSRPDDNLRMAKKSEKKRAKRVTIARPRALIVHHKHGGPPSPGTARRARGVVSSAAGESFA